ncbi:MAG: nucleotidyl transferase AbiEii/AbiGii toxin family protein [Acidobacteriota bacterium]
MEGVSLHWEATAPGVRDAYVALSGPLSDSEFYLAGGTALALWEGHRISADLDLFAPAIGDPDELSRRLTASGLDISVTYTAPETLYGQVGGVQISFIGSPVPLLGPLRAPAPGLLPLASRDDIAAMKLAAAAARGSRKDFIDLWVLITRHKPLPIYLDGFREKYRTHDVGHVVRSLVFFDDADAEPPLRLLGPIDWEQVKDDFRRWVGDLFP